MKFYSTIPDRGSTARDIWVLWPDRLGDQSMDIAIEIEYGADGKVKRYRRNGIDEDPQGEYDSDRK